MAKLWRKISILNPSFGRNAKSVLELSRKSIAKRLNASAQEIILRLVERKPTTGYFSVADLKVQRIITSKIEHHAVLYTVQALQKNLVFR
jgi:cysteine desulfurase